TEVGHSPTRPRLCHEMRAAPAIQAVGLVQGSQVVESLPTWRVLWDNRPPDSGADVGRPLAGMARAGMPIRARGLTPRSLPRMEAFLPLRCDRPVDVHAQSATHGPKRSAPKGRW